MAAPLASLLALSGDLVAVAAGSEVRVLNLRWVAMLHPVGSETAAAAAVVGHTWQRVLERPLSLRRAPWMVLQGAARAHGVPAAATSG